ncbi:MAG: thioredoxin family protein [Cyclobacteriaceae bacterium]
MARTESNFFAKGTTAPTFNLPDTISGKTLSLKNIKGEKGTLVMFTCNHCPYVIRINQQLVKLANDYAEKGINCVAISSNDIENYPQDAPELMTQLAKQLNYPFPYLYDESQEVAKAYNASCTPDFYVFDGNLKSVYHGQLDNTRRHDENPVTGESIREVFDALLEGKSYEGEEIPSMGCGIKWKM